MTRGSLRTITATVSTEWLMSTRETDGWRLRGRFDTQADAEYAAEQHLKAGKDVTIEETITPSLDT